MPANKDTNNGSNSNNKIASLSDLSGYTPEVTISRPDGKQFTLSVKSPTADEIEDIRKSVGTPKRRVKDMTKDRSGQIITTYDDEAYQDELNQANMEFTIRIVTHALSGAGFEIPGDDLTSKSASLRKTMDAWALVQLGKEISILAGVTEQEVDSAYANLQRQTS